MRSSARRFVFWLLLAALICSGDLWMSGVIGRRRPLTAPPPIVAIARPQAAAAMDNEEVVEAIARGSDFLASRFHQSLIVEYGGIADQHTPVDPAVDALCVDALLQSGRAVHRPNLAPDSPFMNNLLIALKSLRLGNTDGTYPRAQRSMDLALANRPGDRLTLSADLLDLLDSCVNGAASDDILPQLSGSSKQHGYARPGNLRWTGPGAYDNLLGVWSGADIGAEIPDDYWHACQGHWLSWQLPSGAWGNDAADKAGNLQMTCAGISSLLMCRSVLDLVSSEGSEKPIDDVVAKAQSWLDHDDHAACGRDPSDILMLENAALAMGTKYLGGGDWYRRIAATLVAGQFPDGSWRGACSPEIETAVSLIFLSRACHPIIMYKLKFAGHWNNRPEDLANLAKYSGERLGVVFNWQAVDLSRGWKDLSECRVLYMASDAAPQLTDADYAGIRAFINAGGLLFTHADDASPAFNAYAASVLLPKLFPGEQLRAIPEEHPIFVLPSKVSKRHELKGVGNASRLLWIHSPGDFTRWWQVLAFRSHRDDLQLGLNIAFYAAGEHFSNRLEELTKPPSK